MIRQSRWLYMTANVGHIVSLVVFAGAVAVLDAHWRAHSPRRRPVTCCPAPGVSLLGLPWPCR